MQRRRRTSRTADRGFTLIEVMVVMVIIVIGTSIVLLSVNVVGDNREIEVEARRLASLIEVAADEAELQGRDFGIEFIRQGYRFVEYDPFFDTWTEVIGDDVLRPRSLPDSLEFTVVVEDKRIELDEVASDTGGDRTDDDDEDEVGYGGNRSRSQPALLNKYAPHAMILSSGDVSPFDVEITRTSDGELETVRMLPDGRIVIGELEDDLG